MELAQAYRLVRTRMVQRGRSLTPEQKQTTVPATPAWTVTDVYRHVTGVVSDVLSGRTAGAPGPEWTAAQVRLRAADSLEQVCTEWEQKASAIEAMIAEQGQARAATVLDAWTHEQDLLGALGLRGDRDDPVLPVLVAALAQMYREGWPTNGTLPVVALRVDEYRTQLGAGEPTVVLTTDGYEFLRMALSRRSRAQLGSGGWSGDRPERAFDAFCRFDIPQADLVD